MQEMDRTSNLPRRSRIIAATVLIVIRVLLSGVGLHAQTQAFTATLSGTVTDPSGAVVPHAKITLTSVERGITRKFETSDAGNYSLPLLPPANYDLQVEFSGFETYTQKGISLAAGAAVHQDVALSVGGTAQNVVVTSEATLIDADNANISADISQNRWSSFR